MVERVVSWITKDGKEFPSERAALAHESRTADKVKEQFKHYTTVCYSGRELLRKHSLSERGVWEVLGEDPNCDMGGAHIEPKLGFYEGTLEQVIQKAITLPGFWAWGGGGRIIKNNPDQVIKL